MVWTNTAGGNWSAATNWNPNTVPGVSDSAVITNSGTYTVTVDVTASLANLTIGGTSGVQTLSHPSQSLTVSGLSQAGTNSVIALAGGTIDGAGDLVVAGSFNWTSGQIIGAGKVIFTNASVLSITSGNNKFFNRSVDLYTTNAVWNGGLLYSGGAATFTIFSSGVFDVAGDLSAPYSSYINYLVCANHGVLKKSAGAGGAALTWVINNTGSVSSLSGVLDLDGGGASSGNFNAATGATLNFGGLTQILYGGSSFTGSGLHRVQNGQLDFNADIQVGTLFELGTSGTLSGNSNATFLNNFNWSGGTMQGGSGKVILTNGSTLSISSGNNHFFNRSLDLYTTNAVWSAGLLYSGGAAIFTIKPGAIFDVAGDLQAPYSSYVNYLTCHNQGLLRKSAGAGVASLTWVVNNAGSVSSLNGVLDLAGGGSSSGNFNAASGATVNFGGLTQTLSDGANFSGAGLHRVQAGQLDFNTDLLIGTLFELGVGGILSGNSNGTFSSTFNWSGGTMQGGSGKVILTNGSTLTITTGNNHFFNRSLDLYTTNAIWNAGLLYSGGAAIFSIKPGAIFDVAGDQQAPYSSYVNYLTCNNQGLVRKSAGAGVASLTWVVNNAGSVSSLNGVLDLAGGGSSSGNFNAASGATVNFGGLTQTLNGGATFSGAGLHRIQNGQLDFNTDLQIGTLFELGVSGTLSGNSNATFSGTFNWSGGTMQGGTGKVILTNGSTLTITSGNNHFFNRSLELYTTNAIWNAGLLYSGGAAIFTIQPSAIFDVAGDLTAPYSSYINYLTCNNHGVLRKSAGAGGASLTWVVNNTGSVSSLSGVLDMTGGGASSGNFNAATGATLNFGGLTQILYGGSSFTGGGLHKVQTGQLDFNTDLLINTLFELSVGGTLSGNSNATFLNNFNWSGGTMQGGSGKVILTNGSTLTITTGNNHFFNRSLDLYTTNAVWSAGLLYSGGAATFTIKPGAIFDVAGDLIAPFSSYINYLTCNNQGLLRKSTGAGVASLTWVVNNTGSVSSLSGVLDLTGGGTSSGNFNAASGATVNFGGLIQILNGGASFSGAGLHKVQNGQLDFNTDLLIGTLFELGVSGTISGNSNATFSSTFNWSGGTMQGGTGKVILTNGSTLTITSGNNHFFNRSLDLYTTNAIWNAGLLYSGGGATFTIKPGAIFDVAGDLTAPFSSYINYLTCTNQGLLRKSAGAGGASLTWVLNNSGTNRCQSGVFDFPVSYTQTAGLTELAGGGFSGVLFDIRGGLLSGSGNIAANVSNGAQVTPGNGVGLMTISSGLPQTYSSTTNSLITFQIGGLNPGTGHDQLRVNSTATLAGTLRAELANGYVPVGGTVYTVMTFTARSGLITNFSFPEYEFGVLQTATNIILIASNAIPFLAFSAPTSQLVCAGFPLSAVANDLDGVVTNLQFLLNSTLIANFTSAPYKMNLSYDYPGPATLTAKAYDDKGALRQTNVDVNFFTLPLHVINLGGKLTNGAFKFCMLGEAGRSYEVLENTNLLTTNWAYLGTMEQTNGIWRFSDTNTVGVGQRYYRAHRLP